MTHEKVGQWGVFTKMYIGGNCCFGGFIGTNTNINNLLINKCLREIREGISRRGRSNYGVVLKDKEIGPLVAPTFLFLPFLGGLTDI